MRFEQSIDYCDIEQEIIKSFKQNRYDGPLRTIGVMKDTKLQRFLPKTTATQLNYIYDKIIKPSDDQNDQEESKNNSE